MSTGKGYYLRPMTRTSYPTAIVAVVPSVAPVGEQSGKVKLVTAGEWGLVAARETHGQFRVTRPIVTADGPAVHDWLEQWGLPRHRTMVVSPLAVESLRWSRWFERIEKVGSYWINPRHADQLNRIAKPGPLPGYGISRFVARGTPDIVRYRVRGRTFNWVSALQYLPAEEEELAAATGYDWPTGPQVIPEGTAILRPAVERAGLWLHAFLQLIRWWKEVKGGAWADTVSGLAWSFWRSRLTPKTVLIKDNDREHELLATARYGGRATTWYYGDVGEPASRPAALCPGPPQSGYGTLPGPIHHVDVRSLYPWLLATRRFPVRLFSVRRGRTAANLRDLCESWGVVVRCRVRCVGGELPVRWAERVTFPAGVEWTTLCGPEYAAAFDAGHVLAIDQSAVYHLGAPFGRFADELLAQRQAAIASKDRTWETFVKLLSVSLTGKLAQRKSEWRIVPGKHAEHRWGEWVEVKNGTPKANRYRSLDGITWVRVRDPKDRRPLSAAYAYLCCYGRVMMREIRARCPALSVVSQDTDGLWVTSRALPAIGVRAGDRGGDPGQLRWTDTTTHARFFGPRHYWTPSGGKLSGYHKPTCDWTLMRFRDSYSHHSPFASPCRPDHVTQWVERDVPLVVPLIDQSIEPDGWAIPKRLPPLPHTLPDVDRTSPHTLSDVL